MSEVRTKSHHKTKHVKQKKTSKHPNNSSSYNYGVILHFPVSDYGPVPDGAV